MRKLQLSSVAAGLCLLLVAGGAAAQSGSFTTLSYNIAGLLEPFSGGNPAVNTPIISQTSTAVTIGSVLVPLLRAARLHQATIGALLCHRLYQRGFFAFVCGHDWSILRLQPRFDIPQETLARFARACREELDRLAELD